LITDKKLLESQRDDFIAIATHELKTPITSIKAYTQVLQRRFAQANEQTSADLLTKMDNQIDKLTKLVGDLLDVSKIETGKLEYNMTDFSPKELVNEVVEELSRTSEKHLIRTSVTNKHDVYGDKYRIGQVLSNLVENAIKYSPSGGKIHLRVSDRGDEVIFSVRDEGIGIGKRDQQKVFERFFRTGENKVAPGFGLGLFISSEIVKNHQGKLWVESKKGVGSTFIFSLPVRQKHHD
jgi:signal transduction histidine kinase